MKKNFSRAIFLSSMLLIARVAMAQNGSTPLAGPDAVLVAQAQKGETEAQRKLANYYFKAQDAPTGINWLKKSANGGNAEAQYDLAFRYENGDAVPEDSSEAKKWYLKSANRGYAYSMNTLCLSYTTPMQLSKGITSDNFQQSRVNADKQHVAAAFNWCGKAADARMPEAQNKLAWLYARGTADVKPNYETAYYWMCVKRGSHPLRESVAGQLTPEKRTEIEQRAKDFRGKRITPPSGTPPIF